MRKYNKLLIILSAAILSAVTALIGEEKICAEASALAPSYNADVGYLSYVSEVENQAQNNYCWAYMADAVLESYLMKNTGVSQIDLSESDMYYQLNGGTYGFTDLSRGGSYHQAVAYWTRGGAYGPRLEQNGSLTDYYVSETAELGRYQIDDARSKSNYIQNIKNLVVRYGAVGVSFYFRETGRINTTKNGAYYYPQDASPGVNHGAAIVGWNDNFYPQWFYNAETTPHQPAEKGAFLIKNSWGKNDETSIDGNTGYYWLSYENYFQDAFAVTQVVRRSELYDYIYETDYRGLYEYMPGTKYDNLYELNADGQLLTGLATYVKAGGYYRFYVNGQELVQLSGRAAQSGYQVFQLANPVPLSGRVLEIRVEADGVEDAVPAAAAEDSRRADTGNVCLKAFTKSASNPSAAVPAAPVTQSDPYYPPDTNTQTPSNPGNQADPSVPGTAGYTVTGVTLSPQECSVSPGTAQTFTAQVAGTGNPPQQINWQLSGSSSANTRLSGGILYVGADEASSVLYVFANSAADNTKSASAKVTVAKQDAASQAPGTDPGSTNINGSNTLDTPECSKTVDKGVYNCWQDGTAQYIDFVGKSHVRIIIPENIKAGGRTYKVTALEDGCISRSKKIKDVTVGKNIERIGDEAFYGCSRLAKIKIKSQKLESIGDDAFYGISSQAVIYVPRSRLSDYRAMIRSSGNKKVKVKAYN